MGEEKGKGNSDGGKGENNKGKETRSESVEGRNTKTFRKYIQFILETRHQAERI